MIPRFLKKIPPFFLSLGISRPPLLLELHPGYFKFARTECIPSPDSVCNHFTLRPSSELRCALADAFGSRWRCIRRRHFSVRVTGDLGTSGLWRDVASNGGVEWDAELHVGCPGFFSLFFICVVVIPPPLSPPPSPPPPIFVCPKILVFFVPGLVVRRNFGSFFGFSFFRSFCFGKVDDFFSKRALLYTFMHNVN